MPTAGGAAQVAPFASKRVLHVGCGGDPLPDWLDGALETRLDIDPQWQPDIVGSMTDLGDIGPFDVVLAQHCLEHLSIHEANRALAEFARVLDNGGFVFIVVPDLEGVQASDDVLFFAPCGPITGHDLIYGHSGYIDKFPGMAHKFGYTKKILERTMAPYFTAVNVNRAKNYNLIATGIK